MGLFKWWNRVNERYIKKLPEPVKDMAEDYLLSQPKLRVALDRLRNIEETWGTLRSDVAALKVTPAVQKIMSDIDSLGYQLGALRDALK